MWGCSDPAVSSVFVSSLCVRIARLFGAFMPFYGVSLRATARDWRGVWNRVQFYRLRISFQQLGVSQFVAESSVRSVKTVYPGRNFSFCKVFYEFYGFFMCTKCRIEKKRLLDEVSEKVSFAPKLLWKLPWEIFLCRDRCFFDWIPLAFCKNTAVSLPGLCPGGTSGFYLRLCDLFSRARILLWNLEVLLGAVCSVGAA